MTLGHVLSLVGELAHSWKKEAHIMRKVALRGGGGIARKLLYMHVDVCRILAFFEAGTQTSAIHLFPSLSHTGCKYYILAWQCWW